MKLVKLHDEYGAVRYVNPQYVVQITGYRDSRCRVSLVDDYVNCIEPMEEVASKLNRGFEPIEGL